MDTMAFALPWAAMALILLEAVFWGEVPEPRVRRVMNAAPETASVAKDPEDGDVGSTTAARCWMP